MSPDGLHPANWMLVSGCGNSPFISSCGNAGRITGPRTTLVAMDTRVGQATPDVLPKSLSTEEVDLLEQMGGKRTPVPFPVP